MSNPRRFVFLFALCFAFAALANDFDQRTGLGPLQGLPTYYNDTTQTTTPKKATIVDAAAGQAVKVKICNGDTVNTLAWSIVVEGAAAPTITAAFASTGASIIFPSSCEFVSIQGDRDLYVVASGASTEVNVTTFIVQ